MKVDNLKQNTEVKEDIRLSAMREAANDSRFLADIAETMDDFRHSDFEFE